MIIAIDPGLRCCGVAKFRDDGELTSAFLKEVDYDPKETIDRALSWALMVEVVAPEFPPGYEAGVHQLVLELQQVYDRRDNKDPNDLLDLAGVVGGLATRWPGDGISSYLPRTWKGQTPKPTMSKRVEGWLLPEELPRVELPKAKKKQHDVWHAIGIGIYHLRQRGVRT